MLKAKKQNKKADLLDHEGLYREAQVLMNTIQAVLQKGGFIKVNSQVPQISIGR